MTAAIEELQEREDDPVRQHVLQSRKEDLEETLKAGLASSKKLEERLGGGACSMPFENRIRWNCNSRLIPIFPDSPHTAASPSKDAATTTTASTGSTAEVTQGASVTAPAAGTPGMSCW